MICATTKKGFECNYMTRQGCSHAGSDCGRILDKCEGCSFVVEIGDHKVCKSFPDPASKWMFCSCNLATHVQRKIPGAEAKKVNPLKASKKAAAGKR